MTDESIGTNMDITVEMLRSVAQETSAGRIHFQHLMWRFVKPPYEEWCAAVEDAILYELTEICKRKSDFHDLDEDALSAVIVVALCSLSLDASGSVINGNCDLAIKRGDYLWLGEAKIAGHTSALHGGYLQLTHRYGSGVPGQNRGGVLIFCRDEPTNVVLAGWRNALELIVSDCDAKDHPISPFAFTSKDISPVTGLPLDLVHIAFPLLHKPMDAGAKLPAEAASASREAKTSARRRNGY